jgi:hypothetical protein
VDDVGVDDLNFKKIQVHRLSSLAAVIASSASDGAVTPRARFQTGLERIPQFDWKR